MCRLCVCVQLYLNLDLYSTVRELLYYTLNPYQRLHLSEHRSGRENNYLFTFIYIYIYVCVCVGGGHVYVVYEDTNLYNDMGIT